MCWQTAQKKTLGFFKKREFSKNNWYLLSAHTYFETTWRILSKSSYILEYFPYLARVSTTNTLEVTGFRNVLHKNIDFS